jgi:hypothetical protein
LFPSSAGSSCTGRCASSAQALPTDADTGAIQRETLFGWKHYDRLLPHRFRALAARLTQAEQEQQEFQAAQAQMQGKLVRRARWYANSFHSPSITSASVMTF